MESSYFTEVGTQTICPDFTTKIFLTEAAAVCDMMERNWKIIDQTRRGLCRGWNSSTGDITKREAVCQAWHNCIPISGDYTPSLNPLYHHLTCSPRTTIKKLLWMYLLTISSSVMSLGKTARLNPRVGIMAVGWIILNLYPHVQLKHFCMSQ